MKSDEFHIKGHAYPEFAHSVINRVFLSWEMPFLWSLIEWLEHSGNENNEDPFDLRNLIIVLPSRRAQRRFLELCTSKANNSNNVLLPPQVHLLSDLHSIISPSSQELSSIEIILIWNEVLKSEPETVKEFTHSSNINPVDNFSHYQLINYLDSLRQELTEYLLTPSEIINGAQKAEIVLSDAQVDQWTRLSVLFEKYESFLTTHNLPDSFKTAKDLISGELKPKTYPHKSRFILAGCPYLSPLKELLLKSLSIEITSLIFSPKDHADGFNNTGSINSKYWEKHELPIRLSSLEFVNNPISLSRELAIASSQLVKEGIPQSHISLGMLEPELIAPTLFEIEKAGLKGTAPGTKNLKYSLLGSFILAITNVWAKGENELLNIAKHPLLPLLVLKKEEEKFKINESYFISSDIDQLWLETLSYDLNNAQSLKLKTRERLELLQKELSNLGISKITSEQKLAEYLLSLKQLLLKAFENAEYFYKDQKGENESLFSEYNELINTLEKLENTSLSIPQSLIAEDFSHLLENLFFETELSPSDEEGLELLGWYELLLDDSSACLIAGCNEELLPEKHSPDPMLPNSIRRALKLNDNDYLFARDKYQLACLLCSKKVAKLFASKESMQGDHLKLTRLIYPSDDKQLLEVLSAYYRGGKTESDISEEMTQHQSLFPPQIKFDSFPLKSISASAIKTYLRCPYTFYLRYILKVDLPDFNIREMSPPMIGSIIHDVCRHVTEELRNETNASEKDIYSSAIKHLGRITNFKFGKKISVILELQIESIKRKLLSFAKWEYSVKKSWKNLACELTLPEPSYIMFHNEKIKLTGTIDRVDYSKELHKIRIIDYKTSDSPYSFKDCFKEKTGTWLDPQLPLYANSISQHLSYFNLESDKPPQIELVLLSLHNKGDKFSESTHHYTKEDGESAVSISNVVFDNIISSVFWPPTSLPLVIEKRLFGTSGEIISSSDEDDSVEIAL